MKFEGRVWKFGDDIDTDYIIEGKTIAIWDPDELAKKVFAKRDKDFALKIDKGDIIVAGENFGCGSSREHAPLAIKHAGF